MCVYVCVLGYSSVPDPSLVDWRFIASHKVLATKPYNMINTKI